MDDIDRTEEKLGGPIHAAPSSLSAQLLDQLADAVLVADADGRYVEANLRFIPGDGSGPCRSREP